MPAPRFTRPLNEIESIVYNHYPLPDGVWGYLDWVTGLVRLNISSRQYRSHTRSEQFEITLNHELFHAFQICTTGYLYRLATELLREIVRIVGQQLAWEDILSVIQKPPASSSEIDRLLYAMDAPGQSSLTIRDLVEGYAFYGHATLRQPDLSGRAYGEMLKNAPSEEYQKAYRFTEAQLGRRAFRLFPLLCYLALLFGDPPNVFCQLHELLPRAQGSWKRTLFRSIIKLLDHIPAEYLGIPTQNDGFYTKENPFFGWSVRKVKDAVGESLVHYAGDPKTIPHSLQTALLRPVILNDFHQIEPHAHAANTPHSVTSILLLAVMSYRILSNHPAGPRMLAFSQEKRKTTVATSR